MTTSPRRVILLTGDGKGKTTAAMGMVLRAVGHGLRVCIVQFIKNDPLTGERTALSLLPGVEFLQTGRGFVPAEDYVDFPLHQEAAAHGIKIAKDRLSRGVCDIIVLDEVCTACAVCLIKTEDVTDLLLNAPPGTIIVLTGRDAPEALIELADTVTVMSCRKHGLQAGIKAEKGVEY